MAAMKREIDAKGVYFRDLNKMVRNAVGEGYSEIVLKNVNGQYYIGDGIKKDVTIIIEGVPGNDLGAFMDGPYIIVKKNAQDNVGNTMNAGKIVLHGRAGDVCGYAMRGGKIFIKGDVGYRVGIHMKGYKDKIPIMVIGGRAGDFLGEYMAGGVLIILGISANKGDGRPIVGDFLGTGMHGGVIYLRGEPDMAKVGAEVGIVPIEEADTRILQTSIKEFCDEFGYDLNEVMKESFSKLVPITNRPYGNLYAY
jgi:glutamate synthase domain-containing protein 3